MAITLFNLLVITVLVDRSGATSDLRSGDFHCRFQSKGKGFTSTEWPRGMTVKSCVQHSGKNWFQQWSSESTSTLTGPQANYVPDDGIFDYTHAVYRSPKDGNTGDQEALVSPLFTTDRPVCLSFVYYMYGADIGSLYTVVKYGNDFEFCQKINESNTRHNSEVEEKLIDQGNRGPRWIQKRFQVALNANGETNFQVFFQVVRGNGPLSDIGLDDIEMSSLHADGCPVDGNWGSWFDGDCSKSCGGGTQTHTRNCTNPSPSNGGVDCLGSDNNHLSRITSESKYVDCNQHECSDDVDECTNDPDICGANADCVNLPTSEGSYTCSCKQGYRSTLGDVKAEKDCTDKNECIGENLCDSNAQCANTDGSYSCMCKAGFVGEGTQGNCKLEIVVCKEQNEKLREQNAFFRCKLNCGYGPQKVMNACMERC